VLAGCPHDFTWTRKPGKDLQPDARDAAAPDATRLLDQPAASDRMLVDRTSSPDLPSPSPYVTTFAGLCGELGDQDGPALDARFNFPRGLAIENTGAVLVADSDNNRIRRIAAGVVSTVAGGSEGFLNGPAGSAKFSGPSGVAVDGKGGIAVADWGNRVIRWIEAGVVSTLAGNGVAGMVDGPAATAEFSRPEAVLFVPGAGLLISDGGNFVIRSLNSGVVDTFAGSSQGWQDGPLLQAEFWWPAGLAVAADGTIYVADRDECSIRSIAQGQVNTLAANGTCDFADGPAAQASFYHPAGVAVDATGAVLVADSDNNRIRRIAGGQVTTLAGSDGLGGYSDGPASAARFHFPNGVAVHPSGAVLVADTQNNCIRRIE
jgi:sugar lactone lactonase YvrE